MSAAASPGGPTERAKDVWDAQPAVGLRSVFRSGHLGLRIMKKQDSGGSIMSKSSVAELRYIGEPQVTHSAAKKGIIVVTKMMAVTYAKREVKLNTFVPGLINSPLVRLIAERYARGDYEGICGQRNEQVPIGEIRVSISAS